MAENIRYIIAVILIACGVFFEIAAVFGTFRFKYVLNRMHSGAMGDTLAILLVLAGLILISGFNFTSLKLAVIIVFLWIAGPVSSHLISNLTATVEKDKLLKDINIVEEKKDENQ